MVDQFSFRFDDWSQIVPQIVFLMRVAISNLADGIWWEPVVDVLSDIKVHVDCNTGDLFLADVSPVWKQGSIFSLDHFDHLTALLEMAFHGFGGGSARLNELRDPTMFHCLYTNGTIYYTLSSLKGFNSTSQRTRKEIERKLPPIICENKPSESVAQTRTRQGVKLMHRSLDNVSIVKGQVGTRRGNGHDTSK